MNEYRVTIAWADDPATVEEHAARLAESFEARAGEFGPAVGANLQTGTLEVTFAFDSAPSIQGLAKRAGEIFAAGALGSGLYSSPDQIDVTRVEVVAVEAEKRERELQPA